MGTFSWDSEVSRRVIDGNRGIVESYKRVVDDILGPVDDTVVHELIIICYGAAYDFNSCFGVWGADKCSDERLNCTQNCHCHEIP